MGLPSSLPDPPPNPRPITIDPAHRVAALAEMYGGVSTKPLNAQGEILTSVALLDENGERMRIPIPMRFGTREEMHNLCRALNIPEHEWPKTISQEGS